MGLTRTFHYDGMARVAADVAGHLLEAQIANMTGAVCPVEAYSDHLQNELSRVRAALQQCSDIVSTLRQRYNVLVEEMAAFNRRQESNNGKE